jgi:heptosyltransferase-2
MRKRSAREVHQAVQSGKVDSHRPQLPSTAHHIFQYLHLVQYFGASGAAMAPRLFVSVAETAEALARLKIQARPGSKLFALNPGAEYGPAKRWPADRFIAAAAEVQKQTRCSWVVVGGTNDRVLAGAVADGITRATLQTGPAKVMNLAGETSLRQLCALFSACDALLTNDTGPMHVAAAVGTPVVAIFGSTAPELTGPGLPGAPGPHRILRSAPPCAPCFQRSCPIDFRCMTAVSIEAVVAALCELPARAESRFDTT